MYLPRLITFIALLGFAAPALGLENDAYLPQYSQSRYGYCDATLIAGLWGSSVSEAKGTIGYKLAHGGESLVVSALQQARSQALSQFSNRRLRCDYHVLGYSYTDAELLSTFWSISTSEAKLLIEKKFLISGDKSFSDAALQQAQAQAGTRPSAPMDAFFASRYEYCDAAALASYWGQSVSDAKMTIGQKLVSGGESTLATLIPQARTHAKKASNIAHCTY
jgi:hypothetical protein